MAQVVYGPNIGFMSGKLGRTVFTKSRSGYNVRTRVKGRNPKSIAQSSVRANFTSASAGFKSLTTTNANAWNNAASGQIKHRRSDGAAYTMTGISYFNALNSKLRQVTPGATLLVTPPVASFAGDTITVTVTGGTGQVTFTASAANTANVSTELLLQPLKSQNRKPTPKGYRTKAFKAFTAGSLTQVVSVPAGTYSAAYRFVNSTTGQEIALVILANITVN